MIWLTWRQFRAQSIAAAAALVATAVALGLTGAHVAHLYAASGAAACHGGGCAAATARFLAVVNAGLGDHLPLLFGTAMIAIPVILGIFWGAPLVARELETRTGLLVWNQSVSRTRWLAIKLGLVGLAVMAVAGLLSLMVTWAASPIDRVNMNWLQPAVFSERGVVPVGYATFAFALAVTAGMLIRRTVPAMAVTLTVFTAIQFAMRALRAHLIAPLHSIAPIQGVNGMVVSVRPGGTGSLTVYPAGSTLPGAWTYSAQTVNAAGHVVRTVPLTATGSLSVRSCGGPEGTSVTCIDALVRHGYRQLVTYQPASRFWEFQWYETAIFVALACALAGLCCWWIRRRVS